MRARRWMILGSASFAMMAGCQLLVGIHDEDGIAALAPDGSAEAGTDADAAEPGPACSLAKLPARPPPQPAMSPLTSIYVVRSVKVRPNGRLLGIDLDDACTQPDGVDSPCKGSAADGEGGVDNAFSNAIIASIPFTDTSTDDTATKTVNENIQKKGMSTGLLQVSWNRSRTDDKPMVAFQTSPRYRGFYSNPACEGSIVVPSDGQPRFKPCDAWEAAGSLKSVLSVFGMSTSAKSAWIADGVLVAKFDELDIDVGGLSLHIENVEVSATIPPACDMFASGDGDSDGGDGGGAETCVLQDGLIAGSMSTGDAVRAAGHFPFKVNNVVMPLCVASADIFDTAKGLLCAAADLPSEAGRRDGVCERISIAFTFEAVPTLVVDSAPGDAGADADAGEPCSQSLACGP